MAHVRAELPAARKQVLAVLHVPGAGRPLGGDAARIRPDRATRQTNRRIQHRERLASLVRIDVQRVEPLLVLLVPGGLSAQSAR